MIISVYKVPRAGVEPARPNGHMALNHACLPVPAPGQYTKGNELFEGQSRHLL